MYVVYVLYALISLIAVYKIGRQTSSKTDLISIPESNYIKGLATIGVLLAHLYFFIKDHGIQGTKILFPFSFLGGMGVLLFFFVSGYGLFVGYANKKANITFWKKRLFNMYIPSMVIELIYAVLISAVLGDFNIGFIIKTTFIGAWFVDVIMLEYVIFFVGLLISPDNKVKQLVINYLGSAIIAVVFIVLGLNERWFNGLFLFPIGMTVAWKRDDIKRLFEKKWILSLFGTGFVFGLTGVVFAMFKGHIWADFVKTISGAALSLVIVVLMIKVKLGNKICEWIGKRSLYFYLIHLGILTIIENLIAKEKLSADYYVVEVLFIIAVSAILSEASHIIQTKFNSAIGINKKEPRK